MILASALVVPQLSACRYHVVAGVFLYLGRKVMSGNQFYGGVSGGTRVIPQPQQHITPSHPPLSRSLPFSFSHFDALLCNTALPRQEGAQRHN